MANLLEGIEKIKTARILYNRAIGDIPAHCIICRKIETVKLLNDGKSHTYMCDCGITIYRWHELDNFHEKPFFLKSFVGKKEYKPNYNKKKG